MSSVRATSAASARLNSSHWTSPRPTSRMTLRNAVYEPFGVRSYQSGADCQPSRRCSSQSRKLKNASTVRLAVREAQRGDDLGRLVGREAAALRKRLEARPRRPSRAEGGERSRTPCSEVPCSRRARSWKPASSHQQRTHLPSTQRPGTGCGVPANASDKCLLELVEVALCDAGSRMRPPRSLGCMNRVDVVADDIEEGQLTPTFPILAAQLAHESGRRMRHVADRVRVVVPARGRGRRDHLHVRIDVVEEVPATAEKLAVGRGGSARSVLVELGAPEERLVRLVPDREVADLVVPASDLRRNPQY